MVTLRRPRRLRIRFRIPICLVYLIIVFTLCTILILEYIIVFDEVMILELGMLLRILRHE